MFEFPWIYLNIFWTCEPLFKFLTKLKNMFILIIEQNNILKFNVSNPTWRLLFIYVAKNICNLIYHAWTL